MSKGELEHTTPQAVEAPPPMYHTMPAMPQTSSYQGMQTNSPGGEYPMQQVHAPANYPLPQQPGPIPMAGSTSAPVMDPATAAAIAGQQYRDQLFAQCAAGKHERVTNYGICGIITAVVCFPCGLICLFSDTQDKCARCGVAL